MRIHARDKSLEKPSMPAHACSLDCGSRPISIGTDVKTYKCDVCDNTFPQKNNLARHLRIHTGERPFKCEICESSFASKGHLMRHMLIHTGEKPFQCSICERAFGQRSHLYKHMRSIHVNVPKNSVKMELDIETLPPET